MIKPKHSKIYDCYNRNKKNAYKIVDKIIIDMTKKDMMCSVSEIKHAINEHNKKFL